MGPGDFGLRHSRWRAWVRVHTPDFLYFRLGLVMPNARDCGDHEWHNAGGGIDGCYYCQVERPHVGPPWPGSGDPVAHPLDFSPSFDELFEAFRLACPSFVPIDDAAATDWQQDPHPLGYIRIAGLAWHLARLAGDGRLDLVAPALDIAEQTLSADPDDYLRALLIEGLIEDLQNACLQSRGRVRLVDVRARLGPVSTVAWDTTMQIWHGPAGRARKILPPGSLPESRPRR